MQKTGKSLLILLLLILCSSDISAQKNISANKLQDTLQHRTLKRTVDKKFIEKDLSRPDFIQRLLNAFKFSRNSRTNEQIRIKAFIDTLRLDKNLDVSIENIELLDSALSNSDNSIESLKNEIDNIRIKLKKTNDSLGILIRNSSGGLDQSDKKINERLETLAANMKSIISFSGNREDLKEKKNRIRFIENIRNTADSIYEKTDTLLDPANKQASVVFRKYQCKVINRNAEVYGIYDIETLHEFNTKRFNQLDYLLLNSIPINTNSLKKIDVAAEAIKTAEDYLSEALKAGCKIGLSFKLEEKDLPTFKLLLNDENTQKMFIRNSMLLLSKVHASAVNIAVDSFPSGQDKLFINFIKRFSEILRGQSPVVKLFITVPSSQRTLDFPLQELDVYTDKFILDFSRNYNTVVPGPMAALFGEQTSTIETTYAWYKSQEIAPAKLIIQLPYKGTTWAFSKNFMSRFAGYSSYTDIRKKYEDYFYNYFRHYNADSTVALMDSVPGAGNVMGIITKTDTIPFLRIYYDDAVTLGKKYQFIIDNKLGGVAVNSLGDDNGYLELWDELTYRFADTLKISINDSAQEVIARKPLSWTEKIQAYFGLYSYIMNNPCKTCFENNTDMELSGKIDTYINNLYIDTLMIHDNEVRINENRDTFRSHFQYINHLLSELLKNTALIIFIITFFLTSFYILKNKYRGDEWKPKKNIGYCIIFLCFSFIISLFSFLFASDDIPFFGGKSSHYIGYSKDYAKLVRAKYLSPGAPGSNSKYSRYYSGILQSKDKDDEINDSYCAPDPKSNCINMPLPTLILIVVISLFIGYLITRYLIIAVIKRKDIP